MVVRFSGAYVGGPNLGLGGRPGSGFGYPNKGHSGVSGSSSASNAASQSVTGGGGYPGLGGRPGGFGGISGSASNSGSQSFTNGGKTIYLLDSKVTNTLASTGFR